MPPAPRAAARAAPAPADESVPLITRAGVPMTAGENAPNSSRDSSGRLFLGLRLYQWGLLALGVGCLYLLYLAGAGWAWMHEGRKYHILAISVAAVSGVWCFAQVAHTLCCPGFMLAAPPEASSPPRPNPPATRDLGTANNV